MARYLDRWMALAAVMVAAVACGNDAGPSAAPAPTSVVSMASVRQVIVDLAVPWRPEGGLSAAELAAQRSRIESAQDQLVASGDGHISLTRRLTETAQVVLSVDDEGRRRVQASALAAKVDENVPDAPSGVTGGPAPSTTAVTVASPASTAPIASTRGTGTTAPTAAATTTTAAAGRRSSIVSLAGTWSPESQLSAAARADQRARVEAAQDEVVRALAGHGVLTQRLTETAQMVVSVDPTGLTILSSHPRVKSVQANTADAPSTSS